jgi:lipoprotein-anchoring transpeptidase ErfK/SrfK
MAGSLVTSACVVETDSNENSETATTSQAAPAQPAPAPPDLRLEVDLAKRQLNVYKGDQLTATHPVAVGSKEWPTPTGEWTITQVVINPRWVPPKEESWAKDEEIKEPGDPENPLGVVQLVYNPPNTVHGTNEPKSLGKAVSHGSIRVSNEVGVQLAKEIMRAGGAQQDEAWVDNALKNPKQRQDVSIPNPVPIRVIGGDSATTTSR